MKVESRGMGAEDQKLGGAQGGIQGGAQGGTQGGAQGGAQGGKKEVFDKEMQDVYLTLNQSNDETVKALKELKEEI